MKKHNLFSLEKSVMQGLKAKQYILEYSYLCFDGGYTFLLPPITICLILKIFQALVTTYSLFILKDHDCISANALISSVSNFSNTSIKFSYLIKTFGIYCKLTIRYSSIQSHCAAIKSFGSNLKHIRC